MGIDFSKVDWHAKLAAVGIDKHCLRKKAGPCPLCFDGKHGHKRFRFDDKGGLGTWFCQSCGAGNGYSLIKRHTGMADWEIMQLLKDGSNSVTGEAPIKRFTFEEAEFSPAQVEKNRVKLQNTWSPAVLPTQKDALTKYLSARVPGIDMSKLSAEIRFHRGLDFYREEDDGSFVKMGRYPVMLGRVVDAQNTPITLHRTYLTPEGTKAPFEDAKKQMKGIRKLNGAAIRLIDVPSSRTLGVVEGIETGLAVAAASRYRFSIWSLLNCTNLALADLPEGRFDKVIIFADHDRIDPKKKYRPGEHHAQLLKERLEKLGYEVIIKMPPVEGTDFADIWKEMQKLTKENAVPKYAAPASRAMAHRKMAPATTSVAGQRHA